MIRIGNRIRLTARERARLKATAGIAVPDIKTAEALNRFIEQRQEYYGGSTPEEKLLRALLEYEKLPIRTSDEFGDAA